MKLLAPFVFIITLSFFACDDTPEEPWWRTPEFIGDSNFVETEKSWFDSIYANLPDYGDIKETECQQGGYSEFFLFNEDKPFLIFEKEELNHHDWCLSYFRFDKVQKDVSYDTPFFQWRYGDYYYDDIAALAARIRRVKSERYFVVYFNDTTKYVEPVLDTSGYFEPGSMSGYAVIVDYSTAKPVCAFKVSAESSEEVDYNTMFGDIENSELDAITSMAARRGIIVDLWRNMATEVQNELLNARTPAKE